MIGLGIVGLLGGIVGFLIFKSKPSVRLTSHNWEDKYYEFLKKQNEKKEGSGVLKEKSDITFIQIDTMKDPVMIIKNKYKVDKEYEYFGMFGIVNDKVELITGSSYEKYNIGMYYNIEKDKYQYFVHNEEGGSEGYTSLDTLKYDKEKIDELLDDLKEKNITDMDSQEYKDAFAKYNEEREKDTNRDDIWITGSEQKITQQITDGKTLEYNKIEEKLIDTKIEPKYFEYEKDMESKDLKKEVEKGKDNYKEINSLITKSIEENVKKQKELVEKTIQDIEKAKEEVTKAEETKKAEEEKKKAEESAKKAEEAKNGLTIGNYTLKYGTYNGADASAGITLVLNADSTCTYDGKSCTYSIGKHDFAQDSSSAGNETTCLVINADYKYYFYPESSSTLTDGGINVFNYSGN